MDPDTGEITKNKIGTDFDPQVAAEAAKRKTLEEVNALAQYFVARVV